MKRQLATIAASAALVAGVAIATTASARETFSISIGAPGFVAGYSNYAYPRGYAYAAPPVVYAPPVTSYDAPFVYPAPVYAYGARLVYSRPYAYRRPFRHHGWR